MTTIGRVFRIGRIPVLVAGLHAVIAALILWDGFSHSNMLFAFFCLALLDWPVSTLFHLLSLWMFPPDPVTHASTVYTDVALATLFVTMGSLWYYFLVLGAVFFLKRKRTKERGRV